MNNVERALHNAHLAYQKSQGVRDSDAKNKSLKFVEPTSERWIEHHRRFRPEGFYRLHCSHDRPLWIVCSTCKRSTTEAKRNMSLLLTGKLY